MSGRRWYRGAFRRTPKLLIKMVVVSLVLAHQAPAPACGFDLPTPLVIADDKEFLSLPTADFGMEMKRLAPPSSPLRAIQPDSPYDDPHLLTMKADTEDLMAALSGQKMPDDRREALLAAYSEVRQVIARSSTPPGPEASPAEFQRRKEQAAGELKAIQVPDGLPAEFAAYLRGVIAYRQEHMDEARAAWQAVLDLPPEQRHYRSTWAAFMLARNPAPDTPSADVADSFALVRTLAKRGFADSIGLAASSYGWEAQFELRQKHFERAIELYLSQYTTGDKTAIASLQIAAERALYCPPEKLAVLARHPVAQRVLTAYLVAKGGPYGIRPKHRLILAWLEAVEATAGTDVVGADRLAWMAYQAGCMDITQRWLDRAVSDAPIAFWVRSKLLLRAGKMPEAMDALAKAARRFPLDVEWETIAEDHPYNSVFPGQKMTAELGALHLARGQYIESLDLLMHGRQWLDASYVAERVLTIDELKQYVDRKWPASKAVVTTRPAEEGYQPIPPEVEMAGQIRHLLARRLMRAGRYAEAPAYYPSDLQEAAAQYGETLSNGQDQSQSAEDRAANLWWAANLIHEKGIELLGTEQEPDWAYAGGQFDMTPGAGFVRAQPMTGLLASTSDERARLARMPAPQKRWHYRQIAADHAWTASLLMPNDSDETARVLCQAGRWIRNWDPQAADLFYKALVRRCRKTSLGQEADRLRWFPKLPETAGETDESTRSALATQPQDDTHDD